MPVSTLMRLRLELAILRETTRTYRTSRMH